MMQDNYLTQAIRSGQAYGYWHGGKSGKNQFDLAALLQRALMFLTSYCIGFAPEQLRSTMRSCAASVDDRPSKSVRITLTNTFWEIFCEDKDSNDSLAHFRMRFLTNPDITAGLVDVINHTISSHLTQAIAGECYIVLESMTKGNGGYIIILDVTGNNLSLYANNDCVVSYKEPETFEDFVNRIESGEHGMFPAVQSYDARQHQIILDVIATHPETVEKVLRYGVDEKARREPFVLLMETVMKAGRGHFNMLDVIPAIEGCLEKKQFLTRREAFTALEQGKTVCNVAQQGLILNKIPGDGPRAYTYSPTHKAITEKDAIFYRVFHPSAGYYINDAQ